MPASPRRQSTVRSAYEFFAQRLKRRRKKFAWKKEMRGKFRREIPFSSVLGKKNPDLRKTVEMRRERAFPPQNTSNEACHRRIVNPSRRIKIARFQRYRAQTLGKQISYPVIPYPRVIVEGKRLRGFNPLRGN